jgi:hypothetical protein
MVSDYVELMGGFESALYAEYCEACVTGYLVVRARCRELVQLVDAMRGASFGCFLGPGTAAPPPDVRPARSDPFGSLNSQTMSASYSAGARSTVTLPLSNYVVATLFCLNTCLL